MSVPDELRRYVPRTDLYDSLELVHYHMPVEQPPATASYIIFKKGNKIYVKNGTYGHIEQEKDSILDALNYAKNQLTNGGKIFVTQATYTLTDTFSMADNLTVELESGAILEVPNGFDKPAIKFEGVKHAKFIGGEIREAGTPQRLWDAFRISSPSNTNPTYFNVIRDTIIRNPNRAIHFYADLDNNGWCNGNTIEGLQIFTPNIFIEFEATGTFSAGSNGFNNNIFINIDGQSGSNTTYGAKDIRHLRNIFINVNFWDLPSTATSANIHSDAQNTIIIGGIMTNRNYTDDTIYTMVIDGWQKISSLYFNGPPGKNITINAKDANVVMAEHNTGDKYVIISSNPVNEGNYQNSNKLALRGWFYPSGGSRTARKMCLQTILEDISGNYHLALLNNDLNEIVQFLPGGDIKILDETQGLILKDRTTGTYYRLYVDNGTLDIEAV